MRALSARITQRTRRRSPEGSRTAVERRDVVRLRAASGSFTKRWKCCAWHCGQIVWVTSTHIDSAVTSESSLLAC